MEHQHRIRQEIEQLFVSWDRYPELYDAVAEGQPLQPDDHVMVQRVLDFFDAAGTDADLKTALIFLARNHWNVGHATNLYFAEVYGQPVRDTAGIESSLSDDRLAEGNDVDAPLFCGEVVARAGDETHGFNAVTVVEGETVMEEGVQVPIESVSKRKGTKKGATAQWVNTPNDDSRRYNFRGTSVNMDIAFVKNSCSSGRDASDQSRCQPEPYHGISITG